MLNLAEITIYYVGNTFTPEQQKNIYAAFALLEAFGRKFYEDQLIDLIQRDSDITSDSKRDMFVHTLEKEVEKIINEHFIFLNKDLPITLDEMTEVANFLYIVQNLEDYSQISYRLHAEDTPRNIIVDLIDHLSLLEKPRLMEMIAHVEDHFVDSLKEYIKDKEEADDEKVDIKHLKHVRYFFNFIEKADCIGLTYFNNGFTSITLQQFNDLISANIASYIDKTIMTNRGQAALDCLSVLMICNDSYELPVLKFKQNTAMFTQNLENITKLEASMLSMLNDFNMYLEVQKQQEALNAN